MIWLVLSFWTVFVYFLATLIAVLAYGPQLRWPVRVPCGTYYAWDHEIGGPRLQTLWVPDGERIGDFLVTYSLIPLAALSGYLGWKLYFSLDPIQLVKGFDLWL